MTRELKFRVWDGEQMISPDYIDRSGNAYWKSDSIPSMSKKVMQFTGLKDKGGKEIYEGDIVLASFDLENKKIMGEVIWGDGFVGYGILFDGMEYRISATAEGTRKVTGNIYKKKKNDP